MINKTELNIINNVFSAPVVQRFASFIIDLFTFEFLFIIYLYQSQEIYKLIDYINGKIDSSTISYIPFQFILAYGLYTFLSLLLFNKTLGMFIMNIFYVGSDSKGDIVKLNIVQKLSRGFISNILLFTLFFIPGIPFIFDEYKRSINDLISGTYVVTFSNDKKRIIMSYLIIFIFTILAIINLANV